MPSTLNPSVSSESGSSPARGLQVIADATATPTTSDTRDRTFAGCVYDKSGRLVRAAQRPSRNVEWRPVDPEVIPDAADAELVRGRCIYLGHLTSHYGHFLLETLSRFWAVPSGEYDQFVFHPFIHSAPQSGTFSAAEVCFSCFGIDRRRVRIIKRPTRFEHLVVPSMLFHINTDAAAEQAEVYSRIVDHCRAHRSAYARVSAAVRALVRNRGTPARIYLSRRKLRGYRPITNERDVEREFEKHGFSVIFPEQLRFDEQVNLYAGADVVAGFEGSAMHNSVFMRPGTLAINLGTLRNVEASNRNQELCDRLARVRSEFVRFAGSKSKQGHASPIWAPGRAELIGELDVSQLRVELEKLL